MNHEKISIGKNDSVLCELGTLVISVKSIFYRENDLFVPIILGRPGAPNVEKVLGIGDAVLFDTPDDGLLEVRALNIRPNGVKFLVSQVAPSSGLRVGFVDDDPSNRPFSEKEIQRIRESLESAKAELSQKSDFNTEQLDLISRKLDEIQQASERLGSKDWKNLVIGTLAGACMSLGLESEQAGAVFKIIDDSFRWLFQTAITLLP